MTKMHRLGESALKEAGVMSSLELTLTLGYGRIGPGRRRRHLGGVGQCFRLLLLGAGWVQQREEC